MNIKKIAFIATALVAQIGNLFSQGTLAHVLEYGWGGNAYRI